MKLLESIEIDSNRSKDKIVNERVKQAIGGDYDTVMGYVDSKRDIATFKAVLTKISSAKFMAGVVGIKDKKLLTSR